MVSIYDTVLLDSVASSLFVLLSPISPPAVVLFCVECCVVCELPAPGDVVWSSSELSHSESSTMLEESSNSQVENVLLSW